MLIIADIEAEVNLTEGIESRVEGVKNTAIIKYFKYYQ